MSALRWKAQIGVTFLGRNQSSALLTESVSFSGIFVRTDAPPAPMSLLRVQFDLPPDGAPVAMHGMVASVTEPRSSHAAPGVEVVFFAASADSSARWSRFIDYVRDAHPQAVDRPVLLARDAVVPIDRSVIVPGFQASDVTPRGIFIQTRRHFAVGSDVSVSVCEPRSMARLDIDGVVRRRALGGREGLGIEYRNMTSQTWSELTSFLRAATETGTLSAELRVVHAPYVPAVMETLAGPWSEGGALDTDPTSDDSWTPPPRSPTESSAAPG